MDHTPRIWTIGHSNHPIEHFLALLTGAGVKAIADVRRFPGSKRQPHFGREALASSLAAAGIDYRHFPSLGGRRSTNLEQSPNRGWRVAAFSAYADFMLTEEFDRTLAELEAFARQQPTATMCAEAVPWRCHRRLISDALIVRGWAVLDIFTSQRVDPHRLTDFAKVEGTRITYPPSVEGKSV